MFFRLFLFLQKWSVLWKCVFYRLIKRCTFSSIWILNFDGVLDLNKVQRFFVTFHLSFLYWLVLLSLIYLQGWTKFYEFSLSDLRAGFEIIDRLFEGRTLMKCVNSAESSAFLSAHDNLLFLWLPFMTVFLWRPIMKEHTLGNSAFASLCYLPSVWTLLFICVFICLNISKVVNNFSGSLSMVCWRMLSMGDVLTTRLTSASCAPTLSSSFPHVSFHPPTLLDREKAEEDSFHLR